MAAADDTRSARLISAPSGRTRHATVRCTDDRRAPVMNLPNALTLARIVLVPLLVVVLLTKFEGRLVFGIAQGRRRRASSSAWRR